MQRAGESSSVTGESYAVKTFRGNRPWECFPSSYKDMRPVQHSLMSLATCGYCRVRLRTAISPTVNDATITHCTISIGKSMKCAYCLAEPR